MSTRMIIGSIVIGIGLATGVVFATRAYFSKDRTKEVVGETSIKAIPKWLAYVFIVLGWTTVVFVDLIISRAIALNISAVGSRIVFISLLLIVVLYGPRRIQNNPPYFGVETWFGRRSRRTLKEGWHELLVPSAVQGVILVDGSAKNEDFVITDLRTPEDNAEMLVEVAVTYRPDPEFGLEYLSHEGGAKVKVVLGDMLMEAVRVRIRDPEKEPKTWGAAIGMKDDFVADIADAMIPNFGELDKNEIIKSLRRGNGKVRITNLGIIVSRINIKKVDLTGDTEKEANRQATELARSKAELTKTQGIVARIEEYKKTGVSADVALEAVQVQEQQGVTKNIIHQRIDLPENVDGASALLATAIAGLTRITNPQGGSGGKKDGGTRKS